MRHFIYVLLVSTAALGATAQSFSDRTPRYHLQPNDVLEVQYRYTPEYNQTATVQPDGFVSLELIGDLKLAGLTLDEARTAIHDKAAERLHDPELSLLLKDYVKPHFAVAGEVATPGRFELRGDVTALEAIAMAGGLKTASAKHSQVILFRRIDEDRAETKVLDLKRLMAAPTAAEDISLKPEDILLVPQNNISKIERFVKWANIGMYLNPTQGL
jgi:polysaccharide biosynthesis/export protein